MKMGSAGLNNLFLLDQVKGHCVSATKMQQIFSLLRFQDTHKIQNM